ncbi:MAG: nuclear transport factor 2 family protein [Bacteroidales bacterium]|nr:nuclear transport factor 2 family protein [Bacteroidales bacterium]
MRKIGYLAILACLVLHSCNHQDEFSNIEKWKAEIVDTEKSFAELARKEGLQKAFLAYAAEDGVLSRDNKIIQGKEAMSTWFEGQSLENVQLEWTPDFVDVAVSGDLGYTYGKFIFSALGENGEPLNSEGIFHTVWKRQAHGEWRFVWD